MAKQIHLIYLPGFGKKYDKARLWVLRRWQFRNISVEMVPMNWTNKGTLDQKVAVIDRAIDRAGSAHVVLVGESAGGSMVVHMMARRDDIAGGITVCGKNSQPETVGDDYLDRSIAFRTLMEKLNGSLGDLSAARRKRIVSVTPLYDGLVPIQEMLPQGVRRHKVLSAGHFATILMMLTLYSPILVRIARRTTK